MPRRTVLLATLGLLGGSLSALQGAPGPGEFQVNTFTTGNQAYPAVAIDDTGRFVVVWESFLQLGANSGVDVFGQRFDAAGKRLGQEFRVNTRTDRDQTNAAVAMRSSTGSFIVAWTGHDDTANDVPTVLAQRFDPSGDRLGGEFQVSGPRSYSQQRPAVAVDGRTGDFVVAWDSYHTGYGSAGHIFGRRYDAAGKALGDEIQISSSPPVEYASSPAVALDGLGNTTVAWENSFEIRARQLGQPGTTPLPDFRVAYAGGHDYLYAPAVAAGALGDFVVVWGGYYSGGWPYSNPGESRVSAAAFDDSGASLSTSAWTASGSDPSIAADPSGGFLVVWRVLSTSAGETRVMGQRLDALGAPAGPEFHIGTAITQLGRPAVGISSSGRTVVAWATLGNEDGRGVVARLLELRTPGTPCLPSPSILCIDGAPGDKRFEVEVSYSTSQGGGLGGSALAVPLASLGFTSAGLFALGDPGTPDVMVKLLDACGFAHQRWFFLSGSTNFGLTAKVTDTLTGLTRVYFNPDLALVSPVADLSAFPCP